VWEPVNRVWEPGTRVWEPARRVWELKRDVWELSSHQLPLNLTPGSIAISVSVCMPWFGPPLTIMQYVMYFRFCG